MAIDPKPLAGDPAYEVAPLLWNRWEEAIATGNLRQALLDKMFTVIDAAGLDEDRVRGWIVVREVLNVLWDYENSLLGATLDRDWITRSTTIAKAVRSSAAAGPYAGGVAITAKYATTCGLCSAPIAPGERIESLPSGGAGGQAARWAHERCAPDALFAVPDPDAAPEPTGGLTRLRRVQARPRCGPTAPARAIPGRAGGPGPPGTAGRPAAAPRRPRTSGWRSRRPSRR